jgi:hypothetical protein
MGLGPININTSRMPVRNSGMTTAEAGGKLSEAITRIGGIITGVVINVLDNKYNGPKSAPLGKTSAEGSKETTAEKKAEDPISPSAGESPDVKPGVVT